MFKAFSLTLVSSALLLAGCQQIDTVSSKQSAVQAVSSPEMKLRTDMVTGQLDNGLKYFVVNNNKPADKVSLQLVVHAGSLEEDDQKGIAHLVEHMAFNGTELYPSNRIIDRQQELGMTFGGSV